MRYGESGVETKGKIFHRETEYTQAESVRFKLVVFVLEKNVTDKPQNTAM